MCVIQNVMGKEVEVNVIKKRYFSDFFDFPTQSMHFKSFVIHNNAPLRSRHNLCGINYRNAFWEGFADKHSKQIWRNHSRIQ